ncbi:MAG: 3-oxoacid CoA-transferase subunit B [Pseudomonadota bacterium]
MKTAPQINVDEAAALVRSGNTIVVGGFGMTGHPINTMHAIARTDVRGLTYIGNNVGEPGLGGGRLLRNGQIAKAIGSYFTSNREAVEAAQEKRIDVELLPQGTLAEALRAGGAGIGGFFTPTAVNTPLTEGRETRRLRDQDMVFVEALQADVAIVRAFKADTAGNLSYRMTESNFNTAAATAADLVIAEVEHIVPVGAIEPEHVHTPCCFVDYLVQAPVSADMLGSSASVAASNKKTDPQRENMARAALAEISSGDIVNLGIGIPTLVADLIGPDDGIVLHTENGLLGVGPEPPSGGALDYPVNAGKVPVTALPGASYFDSAASFGMIRGGHVDVAIMGGLQVDEAGNLANWAVPGRPLLGVGGAMDLARGANKLIVTMTHCARDGSSKVVRHCNLPLTATRVVDVLITDLAVFRFRDGAMLLERLMPGVSVDDVAAKTEAEYQVAL